VVFGAPAEVYYIAPIQIAEGCYLQPSGQAAAKPYQLLVEPLGRSAKVAVAKYAWSCWDCCGSATTSLEPRRGPSPLPVPGSQRA
jgi:hypothetical protein